MIYLSKGVTNAQMTAQDVDDEFQFIADYEPQEITNEQMTENVKLYQTNYFIAGELKDGYRKDDNLTKKKLISIDYDDIGDSSSEENEFLDTVRNKLSPISHIIYPTFNHNVKSNRYRVVIDTDDYYTKEDNANLIMNVAHYIGIPYDHKSETWSQVMGLPLVTPVTVPEMIQVHYGEPLPIADFTNEPTLEAIQWRNASDGDTQTPEKAFITANYSVKRPRGKGLGGALNKAMQGISEGNRNVEITSLYGTLIKPLGAENAMELTYLINENYVDPPLEDDELAKIFRSITEKEYGKEASI